MLTSCGSSSSRKRRSAPADARDAIHVVLHPLGRPLVARMHGPELQQVERPAVPAAARLHEQHRPAESSLIASGDEREQRGEQNDQADAATTTLTARAIISGAPLLRNPFDRISGPGGSASIAILPVSRS